MVLILMLFKKYFPAEKNKIQNNSIKKTNYIRPSLPQSLLYSLCFSPAAIGGALSFDHKLSDHMDIHWKWASAFPVNMESAAK